MDAMIALLPGDGIGPEVCREAVKVLNAVAAASGHRLQWKVAPIGGAALDQGLAPLPSETLVQVMNCDAALLGAVGGPRWDDAPARPEKGLLELRQLMGVYANLRPVVARPSLAYASPLKPERLTGTDMMIVRELTGGLYFGEKTRGPGFASDTCTYTEDEIEQVTHAAYKLARMRRGKVTLVDKANVLETSKLWRRVVTDIARSSYPDVALDVMLVDAAAMALIQEPARFDVLLTENLFGDILSDEAAVLAGSVGLLPSASLGDGLRGLYEPVHGSAPAIAGKGVANPIGAILSGAMMLRYSLKMEAEAAAVERAVDRVLDAGIVTMDLAPKGHAWVTTSVMGDAVVSELMAEVESCSSQRVDARIARVLAFDLASPI